MNLCKLWENFTRFSNSMKFYQKLLSRNGFKFCNFFRDNFLILKMELYFARLFYMHKLLNLKWYVWNLLLELRLLRQNFLKYQNLLDTYLCCNKFSHLVLQFKKRHYQNIPESKFETLLEARNSRIKKEEDLLST